VLRSLSDPFGVCNLHFDKNVLCGSQKTWSVDHLLQVLSVLILCISLQIKTVQTDRLNVQALQLENGSFLFYTQSSDAVDEIVAQPKGSSTDKCSLSTDLIPNVYEGKYRGTSHSLSTLGGLMVTFTKGGTLKLQKQLRLSKLLT
jgi:hypothetical protein